VVKAEQQKDKFLSTLRIRKSKNIANKHTSEEQSEKLQDSTVSSTSEVYRSIHGD
jgi:hypothetical protein